MLSLPNTTRNSTNFHLAAHVQAGSLKLEKLKKLWMRRVKPIISGGSNSPSLSKSHRRRTLVTEMIGFPQDFTHSKHVGIHEMLRVEPQLRNSNDVPLISLFGSEEWSSRCRLPELAAEAPLDITHEDHTMPFISAKYAARHSLCTSLATAAPTEKKVKRKSVPIDFLQDMIDSTPREVKPAPIHETNRHRYSHVSIEESLLQLINYEQPKKLPDDQVQRPISGAGDLTCHF